MAASKLRCPTGRCMHLLGASLAALLALLAAAVRSLMRPLYNEDCHTFFAIKGWYWYVGQRAIEGGAAWVGKESGVAPKWPYLFYWRFVLAAALGRVHAPGACTPGWGALVGAGPKDPDGRFCLALLDFSFLAHEYEVTAEREAADAFVRACRQELAALSGEERALLEPLRREGRIGEDLARLDWGKRWPDDRSLWDGRTHMLQLTHSELARRRPGVAKVFDVAYGGPRLQRGELRELLSASLRYSFRHLGIADLERALALLLPEAVTFWDLLDVRGLRPLGGDLRAVGRALERGELVRFDATAMLPAAAFNVTVASLAAAEGDRARRIAVLSQMPFLPRSLDYFAREVAERRLPLGFTEEQTMEAPGFVNVRRLPHFAGQLPSAHEALHLTDDVLHTVSILWLGPIAAGAWNFRGFKGFHYDSQPNVYVQLAGEADVVMVPAAYTDALDYHKNSLPMPNSIEHLRAHLEHSGVLGRVPLVLAHLRPGEGLTLPSRTFHYFMAQDASRVALNYFFFPKWRRMEYNETDLLSRMNTTRLALQKLGVTSAQRVFEQTGQAVFTDSGRFELI